MSIKQEEKRLIKKFTEFLSITWGVELEVTGWPDESNRKTEEIDAVIEGDCVKIALEHTSIDELPDQRRDDARFIKVIAPLEKELEGLFLDRICLCVPSNAIEPGSSWDELREILKKWLAKKVPNLSYGSDHHKVEGLPFEVRITKRRSENPGLMVGRYADTDPSFSNRLAERVNAKLKFSTKYADYTRLLLRQTSVYKDLKVKPVRFANDRESFCLVL